MGQPPVAVAPENTDAQSIIIDAQSVCQLAIPSIACYAKGMASQAERREATARAVLEAAMRLFGEAGFDAVTVDEIAAAAGVAKGAVYHYFPSKEALFEAVLERTSVELAERIRGRMRAPDGLAAIAEGARLYFEGCADPPTGRILLKDGPVVLGWERWREIDTRHFLAMLPMVLGRAVSEGVIARQPVEPLARMLAGALTEAAAASAASDDPEATSRGYVKALQRLLDGLRLPDGDGGAPP
jgi:AcrR family transcriptional regulator